MRWLYGPGWRWKQAKRITRRLTRPTYEDSYPLNEEDVTVQAIVALRQLKKLETECSNLNPAWISALGEAFLTYRDPELRLRIDAFVLAREGIADIGERLLLPATTIAEYERCFFDIRSKLDSPDFILARVIERQSELGVVGRQFLRQAYFGGIAAAENWLNNAEFLSRGIVHDLNTKEGREREQLELILLQAKVNFDEVPPRLLNELVDQSKRTQPLPTVSNLVQAQIERVVMAQRDAIGPRPVVFLEPFLSPDSDLVQAQIDCVVMAQCEEKVSGPVVFLEPFASSDSLQFVA